MKIEMFEKVGEVIVTELRPASENNAIASIEAGRKAELARTEAEQAEQKKRKKVQRILAIVAEEINKKAESGSTWLRFDWHEKTSSKVSWIDWYLHSDLLTPILKEAGYSVTDYWYSTSWRNTSGKIGFLQIGWFNK